MAGREVLRCGARGRDRPTTTAARSPTCIIARAAVGACPATPAPCRPPSSSPTPCRTRSSPRGPACAAGTVAATPRPTGASRSGAASASCARGSGGHPSAVSTTSPTSPPPPTTSCCSGRCRRDRVVRPVDRDRVGTIRRVEPGTDGDDWRLAGEVMAPMGRVQRFVPSSHVNSTKGRVATVGQHIHWVQGLPHSQSSLWAFSGVGQQMTAVSMSDGQCSQSDNSGRYHTVAVSEFRRLDGALVEASNRPCLLRRALHTRQRSVRHAALRVTGLTRRSSAETLARQSPSTRPNVALSHSVARGASGRRRQDQTRSTFDALMTSMPIRRSVADGSDRHA